MQSKNLHGIRRIALCYIRQSVTRDENDKSSPERQRTNIQKYCDNNDLIPEWYEDAQGHRSGTGVKNRPEWQKLETRIGDPDVAAIVANDMSRLHRRVWRMGELIDKALQLGIKLVFADPTQNIDLSTPQGRMFAQFTAMMDESYAMDIAAKSRSSVQHRKAQGQSVGMTPYGTIRVDGYLQPSNEGAWLLPDGNWIAGVEGDKPPASDAKWIGHYENAERILTLYAENKMGIGRIAKQMHLEGRAYRDRYGEPTAFSTSAIRRIIANWAEYGGYVHLEPGKHKARDRHAHLFTPDDVKLYPERAVFDLELLRQVGYVRKERATKPRDRGQAQTNFPYPLSGMVYCYHCEQEAIAQDNPKLRSKLGGKSKERYRHKNRPCQCKRKSVQRELLEGDFRSLIKALAVEPKYLEYMEQLAFDSLHPNTEKEEKKFEQRKKEAITKAKAKIQRVKRMAVDMLISYDECLQHIEQAEREIVLWESRTSERTKISMGLITCADAVKRIDTMWDDSTDEERQGMVRHLFSSLVFDLDKQQLVEYRLKPWAMEFLTLRVGVYKAEQKKRNPQAEGTNLLHTGFITTSYASVAQVVHYLLLQLRICRQLQYRI